MRRKVIALPETSIAPETLGLKNEFPFGFRPPASFPSDSPERSQDDIFPEVFAGLQREPRKKGPLAGYGFHEILVVYIIGILK